jgi:RNA polymerase sigma-70 factor (ECF subfamily)
VKSTPDGTPDGTAEALGPVTAAASARMRALHDAHAPALYRFLVKLTLGNQHAAEDLLQETLLRAWRHLDTLPDDLDALRPWLFTVARRVAIDAARAKQSRPYEIGIADPNRLSAGGDPLDRVVDAQVVRAALPKLSPEHRVVLVELYFRCRPVAETARLLGVPEGTVKSRAYYALRALRTVIGPTRDG